MATFTKQNFSGDPTGGGFGLADGVPSIIHVTQTSASILDEIWMYVANNSSSNPGVLHVIFGLNTFFVQIPVLSGMFLLIPGLILSGDGVSSSEIQATDMTGLDENALSVYGYINRITP
jgi:hypothetical protein